MKSILLVFLCVLGLGSGSAAAEDGAPAPFVGRIVFTQTAAGDSEGAKTFRGLAASKIVVYFGRATYRQDENGGINKGSVITRDGARAALRLDHDRKQSERGGAMDLDKTDAKVKAFMPWQFKTELERTDETDTICGHAVRRYLVKRSGFVRKGATAHVWIARDLTLPRRRLQFEFEFHRSVAPLPLSIPVPTGTILKAEIVENGTPVTITAVEITPGEPDAALFRKPEGYEGPSLSQETTPEATTPKPAAAKSRPSKEDLAKLPHTLTAAGGVRLVLVLPGSFSMGSPPEEDKRRDDEAQHEVTLTQPYYIGIHEVTQTQWRAVMGADSPANFKGDTLPVENITWAQARAFCAKLSEREGRTYRLPTEAEWEYAARAGETRNAKTHNAVKDWLQAHAWQYFNAEYKTHPVGSLKPNAWGLYDTIGNVAEWTADGHGAYPKGKATDPTGSAGAQKVVRGSDWVSSYGFCRVAYRGRRKASKPKSTIGFRVVCDAVVVKDSK